MNVQLLIMLKRVIGVQLSYFNKSGKLELAASQEKEKKIFRIRKCSRMTLQMFTAENLTRRVSTLVALCI